MLRPAAIATLLFAFVAFGAKAESSRSVAELAELATLGPARAQMSACARLYPGQADEYTGAFGSLSTLVSDALKTLATDRAADLQTVAPEALFMFQEGLMTMYAAESQQLSSERCQFLAQDLRSMKHDEFLTLFGQSVTDLVTASNAYRDGIASQK